MPYDREHGRLWQDIKADLDKTRTRTSELAANAEWAFGKKTAQVLGVLALFAIAVILLFVLLNLYVAPTKPSEKKDLVLAVAQILAGTALLSGLYFTWRTLQVNREGQITDRFTRAIDQLGKTDDEGNKLLEIRLGGIHALERIARESAEDHWPIMEVLTAYVRQHAPWQPEEGQGSEADSAVEDKSVEASRDESESTEVPPPGPDIQAIITLLRRRTRSWGHGEPEPLNLRSTHLREANFRKAYLQGADLEGANLRGADLEGANLGAANLRRANLRGANLRGANLQEANLQEANLQEAKLSWANLRRANLSRANLRRANLRGASLQEADLFGANFFRAYLQGADLEGADIWGANLFSADLYGANLQEAKLRGANLQEANVTDEQLAITRSLQGATMPNGQKYEEWLKDNEGSGKGVEDE